MQSKMSFSFLCKQLQITIFINIKICVIENHSLIFFQLKNIDSFEFFSHLGNYFRKFFNFSILSLLLNFFCQFRSLIHLLILRQLIWRRISLPDITDVDFLMKMFQLFNILSCYIFSFSFETYGLCLYCCNSSAVSGCSFLKLEFLKEI